MGLAPVSRTRTLTQAGLAVLVAFALLTFLAYQADPALQPEHGAAGDFGLAALNAIPAALLAVLMLALTRRPLLAVWCGVLLVKLLYYIDELKLTTLKKPLLPQDFELLGQFGATWELLSQYVPMDAASIRAFALLIGVTLAAALLPLRIRMRPPDRIALAVCAIVAGASLIRGTAPWPTLYSDERTGFRIWSPIETSDRAGLFGTLLRYQWSALTPVAEPDRAAAATLAARYHDLSGDAEDLTATNRDLPDIIVLQSESFFDTSRLKGIERDQVAPVLHRLETRSTHGDLWVPTFGGGTIRTEFEMLTGIGLRYFPQSLYPYYDLAAHPLPTLASLLQARGYRTIAVHPNNASFWNRLHTFTAMGFERFDSEHAFGDAPRDGYFISDDALVDHILACLDENTTPAFIFAISMENHGPYDESPGVDAGSLAAQPAPTGLPSNAGTPLRNYLYHAANADRTLGRLAEALQKRGRRTLLVFYGDHLPGLPETYERLGFDNGLAETLQPVPYLLLDTASPVEHVVDTSSFFLPAQVLAAAGIHDRYFEVLDAVRQETHFEPEYTPAEDTPLGALMRMRQRSQWPSQTDLPGEAGNR
jgi:hypothetical protein